MKRITLTAVLIILALGACSARSRDQVPTSKGAPAPGQDVFPVIASSEIVVGDNRLQIGLIDTNDAPVRSPKTALQVAFVGPDVQKPSSETTMSFLWTTNRCKAYGSEEATFDRPGEWEAVINVRGGGYDANVRTTFEVKKEGPTPQIGEKAPAVDTPSISDVDDLSR